MRTRAVVASVAVGFVLTACTAGTNGQPGRSMKPREKLEDVLLVQQDDGTAAVDAASGSVLFTLQGAVWAPDRSVVYRAEWDGQRSIIATVDAATGTEIDRRSVRGDLEVAVASASGRAVALVTPARWDDLDPAPRLRTTIVVADPSGDRPTRRYDLEGNFEPEAFSADDRELFMIQHVPALVPSSYLVTVLDLTSGDVSFVEGRFNAPPERMGGSRLAQLWRPDAGQLFTLYSNHPTAYAQHVADVAVPGVPVTFVHVLDVRDGWAYCVGLPAAISRAPRRSLAMAAAADGRSLFVLEAATGLIARIDTRTLEVTDQVRLGTDASQHASAVASSDGRVLYAAVGDAVVTLDASSLAILDRWARSEPVEGLALSPDGARLYLGADDGVSIVDPASGNELARVPTQLDTIVAVAA
jgi:hypothetical protein